MFADLADSTVLAGRLDPEDLREVVRSYYDACAAAVESQGGLVGKWLGDGMLAFFGFPVAHEDDAQRAIRAGLEITEWARTQPAVGELAIVVRVGIHSGLCVIGEMGSGERVEPTDVVGETPSVAARVQGAARSNGVVVSAVTWRLAHGYFVAEPMGSHELKGVAEPVELLQVTAESGARSRLDVAGHLAPLVGRVEETAFLLDRWERAAAGQGQVVLISGEPGIGKSRLARAVHHRLLTEHLRMELRGSELHRNSALFPVVEYLQRQLQAEAGTPAEQLEALVAEAGMDPTTTVPLFAGLLGVALPAGTAPLEGTPQQHKLRLHAAVLEWLRAASRRRPLLLIVEDLHWIDPSTVELLGDIITAVVDERVLVVLTARDEFHHPWPDSPWLSRIALDRLDRGDSEEHIRHLANGKHLPQLVLEEILARTDGVPLFVEELTAVILESGLLEERDGQLVLAGGPLTHLAIPDTLQDSLMARLDRLGEAKDVAQLGATIGREFAQAILGAVSGLPDEVLERRLDILVDSGLLHRRGSQADPAYVFKHALIRDAAYHSLLKSTRQHLHRQVADALTAGFPDIVRQQPEVVAYHLQEAGQAADAIRLWQAAYHKAMERSASVEALGYLEKIEGLIDHFTDPDERAFLELGMRLWEAAANMMFRGYATDAVGRPAARAAELATKVGNDELQRLSLMILYAHYHVRAEHATALEIGLRHDAMCVATGDPATILMSDMTVTGTYTYMGRNDLALKHTTRGRKLYDDLVAAGKRPRAGVNDAGVVVRCYEAQVLWRTGWPDKAIAAAQEALTIASDLQHPYSIGWANCFLGGIHVLRGDWSLGEKYGMANVKLESKDPFPVWTALGWVDACFARLMQGGPPDLAETMAEHLQAYNDTNAYLGCTHLWGLLARAYLAVGRYDDGLAAIARAEERERAWGERYSAPELPRVRGEIVLAAWPDRIDDAKACFEAALTMAHQQGLNGYALRAATNLARTLALMGDDASAIDVLAPVLRGFTEGFDTADLQSAQQLLRTLDPRSAYLRPG